MDSPIEIARGLRRRTARRGDRPLVAGAKPGATEVPVECIPASHGEPVPAGGREAPAGALA
jgi:hypothetical protein